jgi:hypothetical protein
MHVPLALQPKPIEQPPPSCVAHAMPSVVHFTAGTVGFAPFAMQPGLDPAELYESTFSDGSDVHALSMIFSTVGAPAHMADAKSEMLVVQVPPHEHAPH